jgi:hypothetical protein
MAGLWRLRLVGNGLNRGRLFDQVASPGAATVALSQEEDTEEGALAALCEQWSAAAPATRVQHHPPESPDQERASENCNHRPCCVNEVGHYSETRVPRSAQRSLKIRARLRHHGQWTKPRPDRRSPHCRHTPLSLTYRKAAGNPTAATTAISNGHNRTRNRLAKPPDMFIASLSSKVIDAFRPDARLLSSLDLFYSPFIIRVL